MLSFRKSKEERHESFQILNGMINSNGMRCLRKLSWSHLAKTSLIIGSLFVFCEVIFYYIVLLKCTWPQLETKTTHSTVKAMLLADIHLLGPQFGHWFDKLRREWQMYRTFQTAMTLHNPQAVFILGDIFDEGYHCSDVDFNNYVNRFHSLFHVPQNTKMFVVIGNHDVGFHYRISPALKERFEKSFNVSSVELVTLSSNTFVLLNSMAMHSDGCFLCKPAEQKLKKISHFLNCSKNRGVGKDCEKYKPIPPYSPPILLQHFPLYRSSDKHCKEPDAAPVEIINEPFREFWDCLSKGSTNKVLNYIEPRAAFSGHTHHGCFTVHREQIPEWTIPSFSWRNKNDPSFLLAAFAPNTFKVSKCHMPKESTVILLYEVGGVFILLWIYFTRHKFLRGAYSKKH